MRFSIVCCTDGWTSNFSDALATPLSLATWVARAWNLTRVSFFMDVLVGKRGRRGAWGLEIGERVVGAGGERARGGRRRCGVEGVLQHRQARGYVRELLAAGLDLGVDLFELARRLRALRFAVLGDFLERRFNVGEPCL